jgi:protein TonB
MTKKQEQKKRIKAALGTLGVNIIVFLILFFAAAWKTAGSGEGQYPGIEVNLGSSDEGSGNDQPKTDPGVEQAHDNENPPVQPQQEPAEETPAKSTPVTAPAETKIVQPTTVTDPNSDVEIKEEKKEVKPIEKAPEKKVEEKPIEKAPEEKPKVVDKNAVYTGKKTTTATAPGEGDGKQGTAGNEGDDIGKTGDKGVAGGTEGAAVYNGRAGGGDGGGIEINGWDYDKIPKVTAQDDQVGKVVFEIQLDSDGEIQKIIKIEGGLSPTTEAACKDAIQKITFTRKSGAKVPDITKGRITFVVRAQ